MRLRLRPPARRTAAVVALATGLFGLHWSGGAHTPSLAASGVTTADWSNGALLVPAHSSLRGRFSVAAGPKTQVSVRLSNARFVAIPPPCINSSTVHRRSHISTDNTRLECWLRESPGRARTVDFTALVWGRVGGRVEGSVTSGARDQSLFPARMIAPGRPRTDPRLRLLSSPDFLNADVADLQDGANSWRPGRLPNSTNRDYESALRGVLDDWRSTGPDAVLVAGDLVNGRWGRDRAGTGVFGPVRTVPQRRRALGRAADTYYPQWRQRFERRGLDVFPAMGDHEFGDDPWPEHKRALARTFEKSFAEHFTRAPSGKPLFAERPRGQHEFSAYAGRPRPDVLVVTLNVFDITSERARIRVDPAQMRWLRRVLAQAQRDGVKWIIVQGHTPILWPVRVRGSTALRYEGGRDSELWQVFKEYGVDLYLAGEVHDITATEADGITQIAHGGAFQFGLTNYLLLDFYDDLIYITARDYDARYRLGTHAERVWETRPKGGPGHLEVDPEPFTVGTAALLPDGDLVDRSGLLRPYDGGWN